jgi:hypothetical protein
MLSVAEIYISYGKKEVLDYRIIIILTEIFIDKRLKHMYHYDQALLCWHPAWQEKQKST